jgi:AraC-like DNA-binding protein
MKLRRDGFEGEKLISLPETIWKKAIQTNEILSQLYLTHIGYFPKASLHFRHRKNGCADNILFYCLRGKGWYTVKDKKFEVGANQYCIIPATEEPLRYGANEDEPWTIYWVHFSGNQMEEFNRSFKIGLYDGAKNILYNEEGIALWHIMYNTLTMGYSNENLTKVGLCLYHFIATFLFPDKHFHESKQDDLDMIKKVIQFMQSKLQERVTIQDIAGYAGLSASHFTYCFRKATGMAPMDYFIHLKMQKACLLLQTTEDSIKNIGTKLGYTDPYYFSRIFKKFMNVSPEGYRSTRRINSAPSQ